MGRRKSRKKIRARPRRTLPKIFQCPKCGTSSVSVNIAKNKESVQVVCTLCGLFANLEYREFYQTVDYYARFLDLYEKQMAEV
ncbi:MAG: hypothetical protein NZ954_02815 [Thermofilaceae archaeon]|nr:hypothetical protein [Thermofilaceae archaeon]MCX8181185.1 hypothetical protein [Thermofilaceae archaeon]MDW8004472.1 hypothetical protein [Thermofilaceae archaeon]